MKQAKSARSLMSRGVLSRAAVIAGLAAGVGAGALLGGCYYPGGPGFSVDRFTYESTSWQPYTVSLVDTRTGATLWTVDVPVGQALVVDFTANQGSGAKDANTPDLMQWELFPIGTRSGSLNNRMSVPPAPSRRLDATLRATPEIPEEMLNPTR